MLEAMDWTSFIWGLGAGLWVAIGLRDLGEYLRGRKK